MLYKGKNQFFEAISLDPCFLKTDPDSILYWKLDFFHRLNNVENHLMKRAEFALISFTFAVLSLGDENINQLHFK